MPPSDRAVLRPSKTADLAAAIRALHVRRSALLVFNDNLAHAMCGPFWKSVVSSRLLSWLVVDVILGRLRPIMPAVYVRARYGEDCLEAAADRGIHQYVIVGAGYETFAVRRTDLMERLAVYELDQAGTQEMKRRRMQEAGIATPGGVRYVAADLNAETLHDALGRTDFDFARPALFSWFGVTFYLDRDAIRRTLESIAVKMAPGSAVMFDYLANAESTPADVRDLRQGCAEFVARRGEPWVSSFDPAEIPGFLTELGYAAIENLKPDMIGIRYRSRHPTWSIPPLSASAMRRRRHTDGDAFAPARRFAGRLRPSQHLSRSTILAEPVRCPYLPSQLGSEFRGRDTHATDRPRRRCCLPRASAHAGLIAQAIATAR